MKQMNDWLGVDMAGLARGRGTDRRRREMSKKGLEITWVICSNAPRLDRGRLDQLGQPLKRFAESTYASKRPYADEDDEKGASVDPTMRPAAPGDTDQAKL